MRVYVCVSDACLAQKLSCCLTLFHAVMIHDTLNYTLYYCPARCQDFKGIKMREGGRGGLM